MLIITDLYPLCPFKQLLHNIKQEAMKEEQLLVGSDAVIVWAKDDDRRQKSVTCCSRLS